MCNNKKKRIQHLQWKKITESLKSSWETEYKWASKSKYWSTENVYFKSQGKNGKKINRASLGCVLSRVQLLAIPWTVARQAPLFMEILQARVLEWVAMPSSRAPSQPRDQTQVSCIAGGSLTNWATRGSLVSKMLQSLRDLCKITKWFQHTYNWSPIQEGGRTCF